LWIDEGSTNSAELKVRSFGSLGFGGDCEGVIRVIATTDEADNVSRFFGGIQVGFPMVAFPHTADVFYNDVEVRGSVWDLEFNSNRHWLKVRERLKRTKIFLDHEKDEELLPKI